jgi:hypothetical protein
VRCAVDPRADFGIAVDPLPHACRIDRPDNRAIATEFLASSFIKSRR